MNPLHRVNDSVLGAWERPALAWLAARLPGAVLPDHLTVLGVFGALLTAAGYGLSSRSLSWLWLACVGLSVNWLGDSLDGTLARLRRIERPRYGFFVDHASDLFCQAITFLSLGLAPIVHFSVACLGLITFLIGFVYSLIIVQTRSTMRVTYLHFGPTEIRTLLLLGNLLILAVGFVDLGSWIPWLSRFGTVSIHDFCIALLSAAGIIVFVSHAIHDGRRLAAEDPPPR